MIAALQAADADPEGPSRGSCEAGSANTTTAIKATARREIRILRRGHLNTPLVVCLQSQPVALAYNVPEKAQKSGVTVRRLIRCEWLAVLAVASKVVCAGIPSKEGI